jgi:hypothetical protein
MKPWKAKAGANANRNGLGRGCDMRSCPNRGYSFECTIGRNPRNCVDKHIKPGTGWLK